MAHQTVYKLEISSDVLSAAQERAKREGTFVSILLRSYLRRYAGGVGRPSNGPSEDAENESSNKKRTSLRTNNKSNKKQEPSSLGLELAQLLHDRILANNSEHHFSASDMRNWGIEADRMMRLDNRSEQQIRFLVDWAQHDSFWRSNILSMGKLRKQFDQLVIKVKGEREGRNGKPNAVETAKRSAQRVFEDLTAVDGGVCGDLAPRAE